MAAHALERRLEDQVGVALPGAAQYQALGLEIREMDGDYSERPALEEVWLLEESEGRNARILDYCFYPDLVRWVADHCGLPLRAVGYRFRPGVFRDPA